jgi:hypothetical protein
LLRFTSYCDDRAQAGKATERQTNRINLSTSIWHWRR